MTESKPCQYCGGEKTLYQKTYSTKLYLAAFGSRRVLITECMQCPPHAKCCKRGRPAASAFHINYCPECGRKLNERESTTQIIDGCCTACGAFMDCCEAADYKFCPYCAKRIV